MKKNRHQVILELLNQYTIETQDDFIRLLNERGFEVTQATISRDIRDLELVKIADGKGNYKYVLPTKSPQISLSTFSPSVVGTITRVSSAQNIVVIRTNPGLTGAIAVAIDSITAPELLGCVAGDDTIIVVTQNTETAKSLCSQIQMMMDRIKN